MLKRIHMLLLLNWGCLPKPTWKRLREFSGHKRPRNRTIGSGNPHARTKYRTQNAPMIKVVRLLREKAKWVSLNHGHYVNQL
ncbi:hypothetical protein J3F84DRAFT_374831 [Trichoderma pleuroticola]